MQRKIPAIVLGLTFLLAPFVSGAVLYDGAAGGTPPSQGWLTYQEVAIPVGPYYTSGGGKTELNTTSNILTYAGFHNYNTTLSAHQNASFPVLDRTLGYHLSIDDLKVTTESHANANRAGFSVIVLGHDQQGIELGFWTSEIWAQSGPTFTHAEGTASFNPGVSHDYDLLVFGTTYSLYADGGASPILTGALRDYSSFGLPYSLTNFLFLGDDTSDAAGQTEFTKITLVPEPAVGLAGALLCLSLIQRRRDTGVSLVRSA